MSALRSLLEPGAIVIVLTIGTLVNRRKKINLPGPPCVETPLLADNQEEQKPNSEDSSDDRSLENRSTIQSRILAHFPFLIEIWYWLLTYWIYQGLRAISARAICDNKNVSDKAERHAHQILCLEYFFHIDVEASVQKFVLDKTPWLMAFLIRIYYSHIFLGIVFIVYGYTFFRRDKYQGVRRALALENVMAFMILTLWRCTPPRLLSKEYGFIDVLSSNTAGSAWTQNRFQLTIAAMPSLHFGNSIFIALCLLKFSPHWYIRMIAPLWPMMMGFTIVATANHFILDALVGASVVMIAYRFNHVMLRLLPLERAIFMLLRLEKPEKPDN